MNFFQRVYEIVAQIPRGKVATYGQIAGLAGNPRGARTVGWAMQATPPELNLPCHRVVNRSGTLSPDEVFGGPQRQRMLLEEEGVRFTPEGKIDMKNYLWEVKNSPL